MQERLLKAVIGFNGQLHNGLAPDEVETRRLMVGRLRANVGG